MLQTTNQPLIYLLEVVIFNSYVCLPEGIFNTSRDSKMLERQTDTTTFCLSLCVLLFSQIFFHCCTVLPIC